MRTRSVFVWILTFLVSAPAFAAITGAVINTDGQPVAGAKVSLYTPETVEARRARVASKSSQRTPIATVQTDSKGNFSIDGKEPLLDLRIEATGYAPDSTRVVPDEEIGAIALISVPALRGKITAGGKPVAGATVILAGPAELILTTDAEGQYSAPDPTKWANRIIVYHPDYAMLTENFGPFGGTAKKGLDRTLEPGVAIRGKVVGSDGKTAVANAAILVDHWQLATSGEDGSFSVAHAPKDWTLVEARVDNNRAGSRARTKDAVTIKLEKAATLSGVVLDAKTQTPLAGVEVRLMPRMGLGAMGGDSPASAFTNAKGGYTISPVAPGSYMVNTLKPGFVTPPVSVSVAAGQAAQKSLYANARGRVVGTVLDDDKRPVAGARVASRAAAREQMTIIGAGRNFGQDAATYSAPDGRFVLRSVATESDIQVDASKKGFPAGHSATLRLAPAERKGGVLITIPRGVALTGKVTDRNGAPLSGVAVEAVESSSDQFGGMRRMVIAMAQNDRGDDLTRTSSDGTYRLQVKEGTYDVVFKREGFSAKTVRGQAITASAPPVNVTLEPGVEITGRVVRGGAGIEGVNVNAMSQDGMESATTGPDGSFRLEDLTPGQMMLTANKREDFVQQVRPVTAPARDVVIEIPPGVRVSGRVFDKTTKAPVSAFQAGISTSRSGGGMVINTPPMLKAFTSDDGSFTLESVPPGPMSLVVMAPGYTAARLPTMTVEEGKPVTDLEVAMDTGVKLTGRVTGPDGAGLGGVTVREDMGDRMRNMMRLAGGMDSTTVTDPRGEYTIEALAAGEKSFAFSRQGYLTETKTITLTSGTARLDATLTTGVRLTGTVMSEGGGPVGDALVTATSPSDPSFGQQARSDSSGSFQIEGLAPGHYRLTASKSGYANGVLLDFDVAAGAPARITMKSGGVIVGRVTGLTEAELQSATVNASGTNGNASAPVDGTGSFRIEGAPTGTVRVSARTGQMFGPGGKTSPMKSIQVEPGASATVDLEFKSGTVVRGRVTRDGQPMTNAAVAFIPRSAQAQTTASGQTDSSGYYEVSGLDDATYNVQVLDFGRITPFSTTYEVKGSGTFDIDIKSTSVRGRVLDSTTGSPLPDARVELRPATGEAFMGSRVMATDSAGAFVLENVARGNYELKADKEGYGHEMRSIVVGDSAPEVELKLAPSAGVTLTVVDGRDNRKIGANIARITDAQGRNVDTASFRFGSPEPMKLPLSAGTYRVTVVAPGYAAQTIAVNSPSNATVAMTPGGSLLIRSKSSSVTRARLIDSTGQAYVRGPFGGQAGIFTLDASPGVTTLQNIAPGTFRLEILGPGDEVLKTVTVTVIEGQQAVVEP